MLRSGKWVLPSDARFDRWMPINQAAGRSHPNEASNVDRYSFLFFTADFLLLAYAT